MITWRMAITEELLNNGESWADVISTTLTPEQLDAEFNDGFGGSEGSPFTLWTAKYVYFPVVYDGAEWAGSVPRNPCDLATRHIGGE